MQSCVAAIIDEWAFWYCQNLSSVTIENGVARIENYAFYNCDSLKSIAIPASITYIETNLFMECNSLTSIHYGGTKDQWYAIENQGHWDAYTPDYIIYCTDGEISK